MVTDINNEAGRYFYLLKSKWVPNEPQKTFLPFVENLCAKYSGNEFTFDDFSKEFISHFGFSIPFPILASCLGKTTEEGITKKDPKKKLFYTIVSRQRDPSFDAEVASFSQQFDSLVNGFVEFAKEKKITREKAIELLEDFCRQNEVSPSTYSSNFDFLYLPSGIEYEFTHYIRELHENKSPLFGFLVQLCEAHLVKNYICGNIGASSCSGKTIYVDTRIILRWLGYCGPYFKDECTSLFSTLQKFGNKLKISYNVFKEITAILREAERSLGNQFGREVLGASPVTFYFMNEDLGPEDVELEIQNFPGRMKKDGIEIDDSTVDYMNNTEYVQSEVEIRDAIIRQYKNNASQSTSAKDGAIECDAKSVAQIYIRRKNNSVSRFSEMDTFFLTDNSGICKAVRVYNQEKYPGTFPPVVSESFIGMIVSAENMVTTNKIMEGQILGYCFCAYRPSAAVLAKFAQLLGDEYKKNLITKEQYVMVKFGMLSNDGLANLTSNDSEEINECTVQDMILLEKKDLTKEVISEYQAKLDKSNEDHSNEIKRLAKEKDEEIKRIEEEAKRKNEALLDEKKKEAEASIKEKVDFARRDYVLWKKHRGIRLGGFAVFFCVTSIVTGWHAIDDCTKAGIGLEQIFYIFATLASTIFCIVSTIKYFIGLKDSAKPCMKKKKALAKKYNIDFSYLDDFDKIENQRSEKKE